MLKEIAVADAYGAGFEFSSKKKVREKNNVVNYQPHDLYGFCAKYTDDTQMSIAIAELLLSDEIWDREVVASKFVECFRRDIRRGYSKGLFSLLSNSTSGLDLLNQIKPISSRNGAAMRSVPLGVLVNKEQVVERATLQAAVTHNTEIGIKSSCAVALAAHFGLHVKGEIKDVKIFLENEGFSEWDYDWKGEVSVEAFDTVSAALTCLTRFKCLEELLFNCVNLCGDTDSVASIAVGLAMCFEEYHKNIPAGLVKDLDEGLYGIKFLDGLDKELAVKFGL